MGSDYKSEPAKMSLQKQS